MGLSIIGAGFGRTGTDSLKKALDILGSGPCCHMFEILPDPDRVKTWRGIAHGDKPNWDQVFSDFNSTVDWPSAYYWRELSAHFPDAKVILSVRDAESWWESMDKTIFKGLRKAGDHPGSIGLKLIVEGVFGGEINDRHHAISVYEQNTKDVQAAFGQDRLLTYQLGSGWTPLCNFLGCPIPDTPYPHGNTTAGFDSRVDAATNATST